MFEHVKLEIMLRSSNKSKQGQCFPKNTSYVGIPTSVQKIGGEHDHDNLKACYFSVFSDVNVRRNSRIGNWRDVNAGDIKIFLGHIIAMGLVRKSNMEKYWSQDRVIETPFFGRYMAKNTFQLLLANIHINDNGKYIPYGRAGHDPLYKVRPFHDMCKEKFKQVYSPERDLSFDEACCPYKGRLRFKCYSPQKPNKFHIKLFQANEASSGYILGFEVYTGKNDASVSNMARTLDPTCTRTTKLVYGLLEQTQLLDRGHNCYMDNYYSSPELFDELYYRSCFCCGTVRKNRRGLPFAVNNAKMKPGECVFRRRDTLLALRWVDKRPVYIISTIHEAVMKDTGKQKQNGEKIFKPEPIVEYVSKMGGVDKGDQLMSYYSFLRKSVKWWRKLFVHMVNMLMLNAFILHDKFGENKVTHEGFREIIVKYLVEEGATTCNLTLPPQISRRYDEDTRLSERHFPSYIPQAIGAKRARPSRPCHVCSQLPRVDGVKLSNKWTSYWCKDCKKPLCIEYCFKAFHTYKDYKTEAMAFRIDELDASRR